jgi:hypothetical protein
VYHWFVLLEITVVKTMNNLNVCSAHSYLYPRSRFNFMDTNICYLSMLTITPPMWLCFTRWHPT